VGIVWRSGCRGCCAGFARRCQGPGPVRRLGGLGRRHPVAAPVEGEAGRAGAEGKNRLAARDRDGLVRRVRPCGGNRKWTRKCTRISRDDADASSRGGRVAGEAMAVRPMSACIRLSRVDLRLALLALAAAAQARDWRESAGPTCRAGAIRVHVREVRRTAKTPHVDA